MRLEYDPTADAAYATLREAAHIERAALLDEHRLVDYIGDEVWGSSC